MENTNHSKTYEDILKVIEFNKLEIASGKIEDIEKLKETLNLYIDTVDGLSEEEKREITSQISSLGMPKTKKKFIKVPETIVKKINSMSTKKKVVAIATTATMLGLGVTITACSLGKNADASIEIEQETEQELPEEINEIVEEKVEEEPVVEIMNEESSQMVDRVSNAMNEALASGIEIIEDEQEDKDHVNTKTNMTRVFTNYYNVVNMNEISDLQWGAMYQTNMVSADELVDDYFVLNTLLKHQLISATSEQSYDFSYLYVNQEGSQMLNDFALKITKLNETTGKEREQASKEIYNYFKSDILEFSNSTQGKIKNYSPMMLDTIVTMAEAWDELTRDFGYSEGAYLDAELEESINRKIVDCISVDNIENIEVSTLNRKTYKDIYKISILERIESKNMAAANAVQNNTLAGNKLSKLDSIENIREEIKMKIDLSLYKEIQNHTEKLKELYAISKEPIIHKNDSGVSDGQGNHISKSDIVEHGVDPASPNAKEAYENAVEEEFKNENPEVTTNNDGEVVDETLLNQWAEQGMNDALTGNAKNKNVPSLYQDAYNKAYDAVIKSIEEAKANAETSTETIIVENGEEVDEVYEDYDDFVEPNNSTLTNDYTNTTVEDTTIEDTTANTNETTDTNNNIVTNPDGTTTEFVPVEEVQEEVIIEESDVIEEDFINLSFINEQSLEELTKLNELLKGYASNVEDTEYSKTL